MLFGLLEYKNHFGGIERPLERDQFVKLGSRVGSAEGAQSRAIERQLCGRQIGKLVDRNQPQATFDFFRFGSAARLCENPLTARCRTR